MPILFRFLLPLAFALALPLPCARAQEPGAPSPGAISGTLQPFVDAGLLPGAVVLVATKDKVLDLEAVGYADLEGHKPMATDALFWIASMTKPMTAAALMMLVDAGQVGLDDPVEKYLPEFQGQMMAGEAYAIAPAPRPPRHPIRVREILSMTSGLPFASPIEKPTLDMLPLDVTVASYARLPLLFEPGTSAKYSNAGINTAGRIVEVVSGMPYGQFMAEHLFQPLGMVDTTFRPTPEQLRRLAKSYKPGPGKAGLVETTITQLFSPLDDPRRQPMPAGGLFSTASDVAKFCQMILGGGAYAGKRYLSDAAVKEMTRRQSPDGATSYGLGFEVGAGGASGHPSFSKDGAYKTRMGFFPEQGLAAIFLVQVADWPNGGTKSRDAFFRAVAQMPPENHP